MKKRLGQWSRRFFLAVDSPVAPMVYYGKYMAGMLSQGKSKERSGGNASCVCNEKSGKSERSA